MVLRQESSVSSAKILLDTMQWKPRALSLHYNPNFNTVLSFTKVTPYFSLIKNPLGGRFCSPQFCLVVISSPSPIADFDFLFFTA